MKFLSLIVALVLAVSARAEWPYDAVCDLSNGSAGGSATLVGVSGEAGLLVSCAHVFENDWGQISVRNPVVTFRDGRRFPARVLGIDQRADLSAMLIQAPPDIPTPVCVRAARPSDRVFLAVGFPWYGQGKEHWTTGHYLGYSGSDVHFSARPYLHSGFSGGALFTEDGAYVGCTNGYGDGYSYAASGDVLVRFVSRWMRAEQ